MPVYMAENIVAYGSDHFVEIEFTSSARDQFIYTPFYSTFKRRCIQFVAQIRDKQQQQSRAKRDDEARWHQTDFHLDGAMQRLLAMNTLPGVFQFELPRPGEFVIYNLTWSDFKQRVLSTQVKLDADELLPFQLRHTSSDFPLAIQTALVSTNDKTMYFKNVLIPPTRPGAVNPLEKENQIKTQAIPKNQLNGHIKNPKNIPDLLLVLITNEQFDIVRADIKSAVADWTGKMSRKRNSATYWFLKGLKERFPSLLPHGSLNYDNFPCLIVKCDDNSEINWQNRFDLNTYFYSLIVRSRVSGRPFTFLEAPLENSAPSARFESALTRQLTRAGYSVLSDFGFKDFSTENDSLDEVKGPKEVLPTEKDVEITFKGGINAEVNPQIICGNYMALEIDFNAFYAAIVSHFELDFTNRHLWTVYREGVQKLKDSNKQPAGGGNVRQRFEEALDITPIVKTWHDIITHEVSGSKPREITTETHPFAAFLRKCLTERRWLEQLDPATSSLTGSLLKELILFCKMTISAAYGVVSSTYTRYHSKELGVFVTLLGQHIISRSSEHLKNLLPKSVTQVMCVTDSIVLRFRKEEVQAVLKAIESLKQDYLHNDYGQWFQIKTDVITQLDISIRNRYVKIMQKDGEMAIKGFLAIQGSTPKYVSEVIKFVVKHFLLNWNKSIMLDLPGEDGATNDDLELLKATLIKAVHLAFNQVGLSTEPPLNNALYKNEDFYVWFNNNDAETKHFSYDDKEKDSSNAVLVQRALGYIKGRVVDWDGKRGFTVSLEKPITQTAWNNYYLGYIRKGIVEVLERVFPVAVIDEAIREVLEDIPRLDVWESARRLGGKISGLSRNETEVLKPKLSGDYWKTVMELAYGEEVMARQAEYVITTERKRVVVPAEPQPSEALSSSNDSISSSSSSKSDENKKRKKAKAPKEEWKPRQTFRKGFTPEFFWKFETICGSCKKISQSVSIMAKDNYLCHHCGHSIFGDFMQIEKEDEETTATEDNSVGLQCYLKSTNQVYDYLNDADEFFMKRYNYKSLKELEQQLSRICIEETVYVPTSASVVVEQEDDDLEEESNPLQTKPLLVNFPNLVDANGNANMNQRTNNLRFLALVVSTLKTHPYNRVNV